MKSLESAIADTDASDTTPYIYAHVAIKHDFTLMVINSIDHCFLSHLDANGELRDHAPGIGAHYRSAKNPAVRALLDGDLGEPLRDTLTLGAVDVLQLALYNTKHNERDQISTPKLAMLHAVHTGA